MAPLRGPSPSAESRPAAARRRVVHGFPACAALAWSWARTERRATPARAWRGSRPSPSRRASSPPALGLQEEPREPGRRFPTGRGRGSSPRPWRPAVARRSWHPPARRSAAASASARVVEAERVVVGRRADRRSRGGTAGEAPLPHQQVGGRERRLPEAERSRARRPDRRRPSAVRPRSAGGRRRSARRSGTPSGRPGARPARARVADRARVAVVARRRVGRDDASRRRHARVVGARVAVVADERRAADARAGRRVAGLDAVAGVAVAADDRRAVRAELVRPAGLDAVARDSRRRSRPPSCSCRRRRCRRRVRRDTGRAASPPPSGRGSSRSRGAA